MILNNNKIISIFIPARLSSKRILNKNIQPINGIPLIAYSITVGIALEPLKTYVSTDSQEYASVAKKYGAQVILRDKKLCQDDTPMEDVIKDFVEQIECDLVVQLLPTTPFRSVPMLKKSIQTLIEAEENVDSLRSVEEMPESAFKCYMRQNVFLKPIFAILGNQGLASVNFVDKSRIEDYQGLASDQVITYYTLSDVFRHSPMQISNLPNQRFPVTYRANGYVDIFKKVNILAGDPWGRCIAFITPPAIEIDTPEQLRYANYVASSRSYDVIQFARK